MQFLICTALLVVSVFSMYSVLAFADSTKTPAKVDNAVVEAAYKSSLTWLKLVDDGKYAESWSTASSLFQHSIPKDDWNKLEEDTRKAFGNVVKREIADQRFAKNPNGLPAGDYMVMVYKTSFAHKPSVVEIVTLFLQNGHWSVVTYQAG